MFAGRDRFNHGMIDNNRNETGSVNPNLVRANTTFGFKLFNELRQIQKDQNILLSPFSLSVALAMARNGAAGETEQAIRYALQLQALDPQHLNADYAD